MGQKDYNVILPVYQKEGKYQDHLLLLLQGEEKQCISKGWPSDRDELIFDFNPGDCNWEIGRVMSYALLETEGPGVNGSKHYSRIRYNIHIRKIQGNIRHALFLLRDRGKRQQRRYYRC
jgi:hypothetical protein